ncbi:MAG: imidazolonepropionase [Gammaproteobacteria bacterium]|nr:imidazolonepropionase [Gammaproteobacteria bacterium]
MDFVLRNVGELTTNDVGRPAAGGVVLNAAVVVRNGVVTWAGPDDALPSNVDVQREIDVGGRAVIPGFVDAHTHCVFAGDRAEEFGRRLRGESYEEILEAGGGIRSTVEATRAAGVEELVESAARRLDRMLAMGTTTAEVKSGYGLDTPTERKMLEVITELAHTHAIDVVPTFLGAHVVPAEYQEDREAYVRLIEDEMLPACAPFARYCDVFCDSGAFTVDEARRILQAGRRFGLQPRMHVEQLARTGGTALAAELGAVSADHLDRIASDDVEALRRAGTVAVLLPAVALSMRTLQPPGRMLWDAGVPVAIATDCNPGTAYVESMPLVVVLAVLEMGLTPEEALWSATRGGALAIEETGKGWVGEGAIADLIILDAPRAIHLVYRPGTGLIGAVVKDGNFVADTLSLSR